MRWAALCSLAPLFLVFYSVQIRPNFDDRNYFKLIARIMSSTFASDLCYFPPLVLPATPTTQVKRIFLCRHGETEPNARGVLQGSGIDEYLNAMGVEQAQHLRDCLASVKVDLIISSALKRARQTAEIVKEKHPDIQLLEVSELAEISWGKWDGQIEADLRILLNRWINGDFHAMAPHGESPFQVEARAVPAFYNLMLNRPETNIVFVVHGRLLRIMLSSILFQNLNHMNDFTHHNTCINLIDVSIESDLNHIGDKINIDLTKLKTPFNTKSRKPVLDDNVVIADTPAIESPPELFEQSGCILDSSFESAVPTVVHPACFTLTPLLLDDRRHLTPRFQ
ncbi:hypothetical protein QVD99_001398 [Batrachochytrium dendrobatidis]|nr:hypothetical protein QVD99_001398 [Batrachochytrium dendrobatidis]